MARYKLVEEGQGLFLQINPSAYFKEDSFERIIDKFVDDSIEIEKFSAKYNNDKSGQKAINPAIKFKVILYAFANGIYTSRKIEKMLKMNHLGFIFLSRNTQMDHSTICNFIEQFLDEIVDFFGKLLLILIEMKLINWENIMIDGTKISSNASKELTSDKVGFEKKLERCTELSRKILERAKYINELEKKGEIDHKYASHERKKIEKQKSHYNNIISKIKNYKEDVEKNKIAKEEKINLTDPDSKMLKDKQRYIQGYNVQTAYCDNDFIVSTEATDHSNDIQLLKKMVNDVEEVKAQYNINEKSNYLLDKGYFNTEQIVDLIEKDKNLYIGLPEHFEKNWIISEKFKVEKTNEGVFFNCSKGPRSKGYYEASKKRYAFKIKRDDCKNCKELEECWKNNKNKNSKKITTLKTYVDNENLWQKYKDKMHSFEGKMIYNKRIGKEHNFHDLKSNNGLNRIEYRSKRKCNAISVIGAIAYNLKKFHRCLLKDDNLQKIWQT